MRSWTIVVSAVLVAASASSADAQGGFLGDLLATAAKPITAPIETTVRIVRGDDPRRAVVGPWAPVGRVVQATAGNLQRVNDVFMRVPGDAIDQNLGSDWRRAYDMLTASQRVQFELTTTTGRYLGACMQQQCSINQLVAGPLSAAMRDAYKVYGSYSVPLPPQVVQVLSPVVPPHVLGSARWVVGNTPDWTVPGFLNFGNSSFGGGAHAVTVGNVIIFSRLPNLNDPGDWLWLLHELRHVEQYMGYSPNALESIDGFAVRYVQHSGAMERDADGAAQSWDAALRRFYGSR